MANFNPHKYKFRTMNMKLLEVADYLDDQINTIARVILDHYKFDPNDFGNPTVQSQSEILTVGRIVPDSPLTEFDATLNSSSLFLETSRSGGIGQRVPLDLSSFSDYSLFPGQIACFKGINPNGDFFKVQQQYEIPYLGAPVTPLPDLEANKERLENEDMKIVVVSGPYSPSKTLQYDQLSQFVDRMNNEVKPNMIVMFGPFLDVNHPQIVSGQLNFPDLEKQPKTLDELFKFMITPILKRLTCQVILVPSTKDATSKHAAYPQDSFERKSLGLSKNFRCFPNPATFQLNELLMGCSNVDVYRDLKDVNSGSYVKEPRFDRIAKHVLEQRRYYPSFPGSIKREKRPTDSALSGTPSGADEDNHISGADLHMSYMGLSELTDTLPDVMVIPSELKYFVKIIKSVIFINPGTFMKMNSNGSYAVISVKAPNVDDLEKIDEEGDLYLHNIWKRARVDIVRS
ncbi:unnamed protein product [Ambrosiozyma monospora]|uniref:Unnamed protein product n=1 Tax=Ambrosiozyma monospora TaxID=43982 RepID=A0ACB5T9T7_AMBMO|nr:unnamed protein product [Ambrosiozyma monospora]